MTEGEEDKFACGGVWHRRSNSVHKGLGIRGSEGRVGGGLSFSQMDWTRLEDPNCSVSREQNSFSVSWVELD